jgi:hypothetical protein
MNSLDANITPFLHKLLTLSSSLPPDIGSWNPSGTVFIVVNGSKFEILLRKYFKGTLQTFVRQLHFYGFSKTDLIGSGMMSWSFSHSCFLRDDSQKMLQIKRKGHHFPESSPTYPPKASLSQKTRMTRMKMKLEMDEIVTKNKEVETDELQRKVTLLQETVDKLMVFVENNWVVVPATNKNKKRKLIHNDSSDENEEPSKGMTIEVIFNRCDWNW